MIGDIMTITRLRMGTDGEGVSTLVTFFDCPLHCKYCINDFCHEDEYALSCIPRAAYTPEELIRVLKKDDIYYQMSGGGIVFGGGEPLLQSSFIHEVCMLADPAWKKRIETSLNVPWRYVEPVLNDIDEWIIDVKDVDETIYRKYTGVAPTHLKQNLFRIQKAIGNKKFHFRVPRIPGYNTEENVKNSVHWIKELFHSKPEVFDYIKTPNISKSWLDEDSDDE